MLLAVFTTAAAAAAELFVVVVVFFDELELLDPPHAASAIAPAAPRATRAWPRCRRLRPRGSCFIHALFVCVRVKGLRPVGTGGLLRTAYDPANGAGARDRAAHRDRV